MHLKDLHIVNFKNFKVSEFAFSERINCVIGENGIGKTNLLDSIYYLSYCRSYFQHIDSSNINFEEKYFTLHGDYLNSDGTNDSYHCYVSRDKKKIFKKNDKQYERLSDHIGQIPLIIITPYDILLINEGSDERRKFFDAFISQFDNEYLLNVIHYNKLLNERNKLLKNVDSPIDTELMDVINYRMSVLGSAIFDKRKLLINDISRIFEKYFSSISPKDIFTIEYDSQLFKNDFYKTLTDTKERDMILGYTTTGVHRDDFVFRMNGAPIKTFGSQGQRKSFLLSLKFTQQEITFLKTGIKPILILDDLFDKLDKSRVQKIIEIISSDLFGQIFISDTDKSNLSKLFPQENAFIVDLSISK